MIAIMSSSFFSTQFSSQFSLILFATVFTIISFHPSRTSFLYFSSFTHSFPTLFLYSLFLCILFFLPTYTHTHTSVYLNVKFFTFWEGDVYSRISLNVYDIRWFMPYELQFKWKQAIKVLFPRVRINLSIISCLLTPSKFEIS